MKAPRLTRALMLEARSETPDGAGGLRESWALCGTLWAELRAGTGARAAGDPVAQSRQNWRIVTRAAVPGDPRRPVAGQRFREGGRIFAILSVAEGDALGRYLIVTAREEGPL